MVSTTNVAEVQAVKQNPAALQLLRGATLCNTATLNVQVK
jgi:hypothetical protein